MTEYDKKALAYAETIGVIEYEVNGPYMEYWSFFGALEGWYFVRYNLDTEHEDFRGANIPFVEPIPKFLLSQNGACKYNYMCG